MVGNVQNHEGEACSMRGSNGGLAKERRDRWVSCRWGIRRWSSGFGPFSLRADLQCGLSGAKEIFSAWPPAVRVWLATGYTDMRKGFPSLALQVQEILHRDPLNGHLFCFRGRRGNLLKVIWHDGQGACLPGTRPILWPSAADGVVTISSAQFGYRPHSPGAPKSRWRGQRGWDDGQGACLPGT